MANDANANDARQVAALSRPIKPGMLYDCRNDTFIPGVTLWSKKELEAHITTNYQEYAEFEITTSQKIDDKAKALDISAELSLSLMNGFVSVEGSAKFFMDESSSSDKSRVTLQYKTFNKFETLSQDHLGEPKFTSVFEHGTATHVCTAVQYGVDVFLVFESNVDNDSSKTKVGGKLAAAIKELSISGEIAGEINSEEKKFRDNISCNYNGDYIPDNIPFSFDQAKDLLAGLPGKIRGIPKLKPITKNNQENAKSEITTSQNIDDKAKSLDEAKDLKAGLPGKIRGDPEKKGIEPTAKKIYLYPLKLLKPTAAELLSDISNATVSRVKELFQDYTDLQKDIQTVLDKDLVKHTPFLDVEAEKLKKITTLASTTFMSKIKPLLPLVRGSDKNEEEGIVEIICKWEASPYSPAELRKHFKILIRNVSIVSMFINDAKIFGIESKINEDPADFLGAMDEKAIAFTFNEKTFRNDDLEEALKNFLSGDFEHTKHSPHNTLLHKELIQAEQLYKLFIGYFENRGGNDAQNTQEDNDSENSDSEDPENPKKIGVKFIIYSSDEEDECDNDDAIAYISLRTWIGGEEFSLPTVPDAPQYIEDSKTSTSLELMILEPEVMGDKFLLTVFENGVEFKMMDVSNDNSSQFTVDGLNPSMEYSFKVQNVSEIVGNSAFSVMSEKIELEVEDHRSHFPSLAGTIWQLSNEGINVFGTVEFLEDGGTKWNNGDVHGFWKLVDENRRLQLECNGLYHELEYLADEEKGVVMIPYTSPPALMWQRPREFIPVAGKRYVIKTLDDQVLSPTLWWRNHNSVWVQTAPIEYGDPYSWEIIPIESAWSKVVGQKCFNIRACSGRLLTTHAGDNEINPYVMIHDKWDCPEDETWSIERVGYDSFRLIKSQGRHKDKYLVAKDVRNEGEGEGYWLSLTADETCPLEWRIVEATVTSGISMSTETDVKNYLKRPLRVGDVVSAWGVFANESSQFSMNLMMENDEQFMLSINFRPPPDENKVVMNSKLSGWGDEIRTDIPNFLDGQIFRVDVECVESEFKIHLEDAGKVLTSTFPYREGFYLEDVKFVWLLGGSNGMVWTQLVIPDPYCGSGTVMNHLTRKGEDFYLTGDPHDDETALNWKPYFEIPLGCYQFHNKIRITFDWKSRGRATLGLRIRRNNEIVAEWDAGTAPNDWTHVDKTLDNSEQLVGDLTGGDILEVGRHLEFNLHVKNFKIQIGYDCN